MKMLLLAIGGGSGAVARYLLGQWLLSFLKKPVIPVAMLTVNLLGALGLGVILGVRYKLIPVDAYQEPLYLIVVIGFFGAFTTFSTFSMEARELLVKKDYLNSGVYILVSIGGSILLFIIGLLAGKFFYPLL